VTEATGFSAGKTAFDAVTTATVTIDGTLLTVGNVYTIDGTS